MEKSEEKKRKRRMLRKKIWLSIKISGQKGGFKSSVWRRLYWTSSQSQRRMWFIHFYVLQGVHGSGLKVRPLPPSPDTNHLSFKCLFFFFWKQIVENLELPYNYFIFMTSLLLLPHKKQKPK